MEKLRPEIVLDEEGGVEFAHSHIIVHCNDRHCCQGKYFEKQILLSPG